MAENNILDGKIGRRTALTGIAAFLAGCSGQNNDTNTANSPRAGTKTSAPTSSATITAVEPAGIELPEGTFELSLVPGKATAARKRIEEEPRLSTIHSLPVEEQHTIFESSTEGEHKLPLDVGVPRAVNENAFELLNNMTATDFPQKMKETAFNPPEGFGERPNKFQYGTQPGGMAAIDYSFEELNAEGSSMNKHLGYVMPLRWNLEFKASNRGGNVQDRADIYSITEQNIINKINPDHEIKMESFPVFVDGSENGTQLILNHYGGKNYSNNTEMDELWVEHSERIVKNNDGWEIANPIEKAAISHTNTQIGKSYTTPWEKAESTEELVDGVDYKDVNDQVVDLLSSITMPFRTNKPIQETRSVENVNLHPSLSADILYNLGHYNEQDERHFSEYVELSEAVNALGMTDYEYGLFKDQDHSGDSFGIRTFKLDSAYSADNIYTGETTAEQLT